MPYEPFYERFPGIAERETRSVTTRNHPELPDDEYLLVEAYCNEPDCDCRRVFVNVVSKKRKDILAVVAYGWENREYYVDWFGDDQPYVINELKGPALNSASRQSELAPALLRIVAEILEDRKYIARLKRHYRLFRGNVDSQAPKGRNRRGRKRR